MKECGGTSSPDVCPAPTAAEYSPCGVCPLRDVSKLPYGKHGMSRETRASIAQEMRRLANAIEAGSVTSLSYSISRGADGMAEWVISVAGPVPR